MATPSRYFQEGGYYHVYNRGNRKQKIFLQSRDYRRFLERMCEYKEKFAVSVLSYCLMPNHFHLLLKQETSLPLTAFMLRLGTSYAKYFNIKYEEVGSLFQGRFKAKQIESDEYLLHLSRYIHRNPVSTPGVELGDFPWSSYSAYLKGVKNQFVDPTTVLGYFSKTAPLEDYKSFTEFDAKEEEAQTISDFLFDDED